ncbi:MAG TPA: amino acid adenylation domain-containing protein, partial [Longimicrobiaceae bacterium]|nr:amino acid adenylation domain-containing protein [Longimicrobiaceae bacterium]
AERVEALRGGGPERVPPPVVPAPRDRPLPLSFAQQRLWFIDQLHPGSSAYNVAFPLRLHGRLDVAAMRRALTALADRHEVLRTVFGTVDGAPVQVVRPPAEVAFPVMDLRGPAEEAREREARRLVAEESARGFDLASGPLMRAGAVRVAEEEWVLLFTLHHIVSDGWSMEVLVREVSALYAAFAAGEEPSLPELPVQYADYAVWQRAWLSGDVLQEHLAFWRESLAGAPPLLELPTDRPRPAVAGYAAGASGFELGAEATAALRALARREGATLFMTLLAAWQLLLSRYAGQEDVVVGTPVAGRDRLETEGLIGFFVNTLVLRTDLSGAGSFRELLHRVRETTLGAYQHQELPFEKLVEELGTGRSLAHTPLFQVMFTHRADTGEELRLGGARVEGIGGAGGTVKFDLLLTQVEAEDTIQGHLAYRADLWEAGSMERLLEHYVRILEEVGAHPERKPAELSLLGAAERTRVLEAWNDTAADRPRACVHEQVAAQAARSPDAPAVVSDAETLTYAELEGRANRLAHHLRALGAGPEARVGLLLERGAATVVAVLAILKAGAAYVALDPAHPDERLRFVLADAGAQAVITCSRLAGRLGGFGGAVVCLDADAEAVSRRPGTPPESGVGPRSLAYVIYTSGSTGTPKGVLLEHGGLSNYLRWFDETVLGPEGFVLPLVSRLTFDAHVRQLFPPLLRGEAVRVLPEAAATDPGALLRAISTGERVSFGGVPSLWSAMLELVSSGHAAKPAGLKAVLLGGETLPPELAERTFAHFPDVALWNHYGPTEATVNTAVARVRPGAAVGIGRPIANVRVYLLDGEGGPVPAGVPGELYVGGDGVARGYLGQPGRTAERFLPDPFAPVPGARMYRSGDRARWRLDGELEYLGRVDEQVKVRGFRVEPGEIEAALERHPGVRQAAVAAREDTPGQKRLVAYVVAEPGAAAPPEELRAHLAARLPEYMVPAAFVPMEVLPLTRNGKLDRRALPAPEWSPGEAYVAPRTPAEEMLCGIWAEVLQRERVGVRDDFFALGGHSLLAVRLLARVEQLTGKRVTVAELFAGPDVERMAAALSTDSVRESSTLVPIRTGGTARPLFFVHAAGGNVLGYADLARHLGAGQPFYGLQARGVDGDEAPRTTVAEMAADYLAAVRTVQPEGPFRLGGWSMGGMVAFEMARQAEAAGQRVELLVLVDPPSPGRRAVPTEADEPGLLASFARHLGLPLERIALSPEEILRHGPGERLRRAWEAARAGDALPPELDFARFRRLWTVFRTNVAASRAYRPGRATADVLLVQAEDRTTPAAADAALWTALTTGTVRSATLPGDHFTLLREPHVGALASRLAEALAPRPGEAP